MSNLTISEQNAAEILFSMKSGYVLDFTDYTFKMFVLDATNINLDDPNISRYSGLSKGKKLRAFFSSERALAVGTLLKCLIEYVNVRNLAAELDNRTQLIETLQNAADRLSEQRTFENIDVIDAFADERSLSILISTIQDSCRKDGPEAVLDRLHTLMTKILRVGLAKHSVTF